ncbi:hypothetical protein A2U01_0055504, partial [Trifolium medium]|nr:hypothetical protein [Trifolium medium]
VPGEKQRASSLSELIPHSASFHHPRQARLSVAQRVHPDLGAQPRA